MKLWLDDIRKPPEGYVWAKTAAEAIAHLQTGEVQYVSFDHDLGGKKSGYDVAKEVMRLCFEKAIKCPKWRVHSSNPVGRENIEAAMHSALGFSQGDSG